MSILSYITSSRILSILQNTESTDDKVLSLKILSSILVFPENKMEVLNNHYN
jgi:hypothetical protein